MKTLRVVLLMVVLSAIFQQLQAQSTIGRQKVDQFPVNATGTLTYGLTWLPADYNTTTTRYPLIIFLHGSGENGTTVNDLNKLVSTALPMKIAQGWDPVAVNPVNNQAYKFIVVSPQAPTWSYGFPQIQHILNDVVSRYRVDTTRIYFTGLSAGGAGTNASVTNGASMAMRVAAIVPVAAAGTNTPTEGAVVPLIGGTYGVKVWNVCGTDDWLWPLNVQLTDSINNATPAPSTPAILTGLPGIGHTSVAWNTAYDPNWRTNSQNLNIYEWMLKYSRSSNSGTTNQLPSANAGADQNIPPPTTSTTLVGSGTDPDGTITSYQWTKVSGPVSGIITTPNGAQTTVTGLSTGTYVFRLRVTDNMGATAQDDVTINVLSSGTYSTLPGKVEAENWSAMSGVQTETAYDNQGGALNVAYVDNGDWMDYNVISLTDTTYLLKLRVATPFNNAVLQIKAANGTVLASINLPNTGAWQNWQTVNASISLPQGQQTIKVVCTSAEGWNLNWLDFTFPPPPPPPLPSFVPTANSFASYVPYNGKYMYGVNPGWYGFNWSTQDLATLAMGNPAINVKGAGAKSLRMPIYDDFVTTYGLTSLIGDFQHFSSLGGGEFTAFVGSPHPTHRETTTFPGSPEPARTFKNLYEPIWLDSAQTIVNPNNYYAKYLFDVVSTYGAYVKFWEIVNEPDYTYSGGGWQGDINPPIPGSWFDQDPTPEELVNLRAPIEHYVRMLRISWEVIKKLQPDDYVCTGGIGYISFLDAVLRKTDNPVDGSVTSEYPLKGGAYFDVISFHNYPMYNLSQWSNAIGGFEYFRHSDAATRAYLHVKKSMDSIAALYGYNNVTYPGKQFICSETGVARTMDGVIWGTNEGQKNYIIKAQVASQKNGIKQLYWYQTGDGADPNFQFDQMGLYYYFGDNQPYNATKADQGIALKTTSDLLFDATFDSTRTAALNLPATIDGGAFKRPNNTFVYVLWAKTNTDLSENASATYTFPTGIIPGGYLTQKLWNFSETNSSTTVSSNGIVLNATPAFFESAPAPNLPPVANAGQDQVITLPTNSVNLNGTATDPDGTISSVIWSKVSGPAQHNITNANTLQTSITGLVQGTYAFRLQVTDNNGASDDDTLMVIVNPAPNEAPIVNAGSDVTITLPTNSVTLIGNATDADGTIASFQWTKISGPSQGTIVSASQPQTSVNNLVQGIYQFELSATDNRGATGRDTVTVTVNTAPNVPPTANAGLDQNLTLPNNATTLNGSGNDPDGSIISYSWRQIAGPATANLTTANQAQTAVNSLVQGVYQFELRVTDNNGATGKDTVNINVNAAVNRPPLVNAGQDTSITLPANSVKLNGTASDPDGTITAIQWKKISGPASFSMGTQTLITTVTGLKQGTYQFELTVTDNSGASASDTITVQVLGDLRRRSIASLYPNPASSFIVVEVDAITHLSQTAITIHNTGGILVHYESITRSQQTMTKQINIAHLQKGAYILTINTDINTVQTIKFVKQ